MPKPVSRTSAVAAVHQDIGRLDVLVDEAALMDLAQRCSDLDGEAQEASHLHRRAEQPVSGSPPGSSSTSMVRVRSCTSSSGLAAHAPSSSSFNPYS